MEMERHPAELSRSQKDLDESLEGKDVLVVEDIIDSGRTLSYLLEILKKRNPNSMKLCTLLDKPERRVMDVNVDYVGLISQMNLLWDMDWIMRRNIEIFHTSELWKA